MSKKNIGFENIINLLNEKLSFVTVNSETINLLKTDEKFDSIFSNLLATLITLEEKNKVKDKKSTDLKEAYKTITNKEFNGKCIEFNDVDDIEDQLNYIDVYLKNTFGNDFFDKNNNSNSKEEVLEATKIVDGQEVHNFNDTKNNNKFNAEEYLKHNNVTIDQMADQMVNQQAQILLNKDIMNNKIYKFDSKPKIVVFLKFLNNIIFLLLACSCLIFGIMSFTNQYISKFVENSTEKFYFISGGPDASVFQIMGIVLLVLFAMVKLFYEIKFFKNDNYKYSIKLSYVFFLILIFIFFIIDYINFLKMYPNSKSLIDSAFNIDQGVLVETVGGKYINTSNAYNILEVQFYFIILILSLFGVLLINSLILIIIKPRIDVERLQKIVSQYVQDIKNGKINTDNLGGIKGSNPFGGMFF